MASRLPLMLLLSFLAVRVDSQPQRSTFRRPAPDPRSRQSSFEGPPPYQPGYQPEKSPSVPIPVGVRRCDNYYNGGSVLPCLMRPQLPPFSYSTEKYYNTEYKKKK